MNHVIRLVISADISIFLPEFFNNLGQALVMDLKFYTSVAKGLKLKVRKFWLLIPTFVEVTE